MSAPDHGWRGPHAWRLTRRTDHANGNSSLAFRCRCGAWERVTRLPTEDADLAIQDRVDRDDDDWPDCLLRMFGYDDDVLMWHTDEDGKVRFSVAARRRGLRPQGASYRYYPESLWPLFDAAGPARDVDPVDNPYPHPGRKP